METKNADTFVLKELEAIKMDNHFLVSPHSLGGGGLALLWSQEVDISILAQSHNFLDTAVKFKGANFFITFVYGEPEVARRQLVWDALSHLAADRSSPWLLTGDFNEIIDNTEKSGGPVRSERSFSAFREFLAYNDLFDLRHTGNCLSWRGRRGNHLVHCRLDRTMANSSWYDSFPQGRSHYLRFHGSDHRPIYSTFDAKRKRHTKIFCYDRRLKDVEEVKELIESTWNASPEATVAHRLAACRRAIARWSREHHTNSRKAIVSLQTRIDEAMTGNAPDDTISNLNKQLLEAYKEEEVFWKQRSRLLWLTLGDKNTGFFHTVSKGRKARNHITMLEDPMGQSVYEEEQIAEEIARYFDDIFRSIGSDGEAVIERALSRQITPETNQALTTIPTPLEVKKALFAIHPDKAPGPDGFSASFFQANWTAVGPAIVEEVREFFITGRMPETINMTHVRLIPKNQNALKVSDYRPIALCNVYYKIISKILSLRLRLVLGSIFSENQSAFLPGRAIADNVLITHEILHYLKDSEAKKHCYMAVKTDMSKAYNRLEWRFIRLVFERLGFDPVWVNWITSVSQLFLIPT